jgi:hypothetical protein
MDEKMQEIDMDIISTSTKDGVELWDKLEIKYKQSAGEIDCVNAFMELANLKLRKMIAWRITFQQFLI